MRLFEEFEIDLREILVKSPNWCSEKCSMSA